MHQYLPRWLWDSYTLHWLWDVRRVLIRVRSVREARAVLRLMLLIAPWHPNRIERCEWLERWALAAWAERTARNAS